MHEHEPAEPYDKPSQTLLAEPTPGEVKYQRRRHRRHRRPDECREEREASLPHQKACQRDRKSTRLNSSHANISYAVFCLKKKKNYTIACQGPHARNCEPTEVQHSSQLRLQQHIARRTMNVNERMTNRRPNPLSPTSLASN